MNTRLFILSIFLLTPLFEATAGKVTTGGRGEFIKSNTGKYTLRICDGGLSSLLDGKTGHDSLLIPHTLNGNVAYCEFNKQDSLLFITDNNNGRGLVWDLNTGEILYSVTLPAEINKVEFTPQNELCINDTPAIIIE